MPQQLSAEVNINVKGAQTSLNNLAKSSKTAGESLQRNLAKSAIASENAINKINATSGRATTALTNFGRIAQDAAFGPIAIANNIEPLILSLTSLKNTAGGVGGALKALGSSLLGAGGLAVAFSAVTFFMSGGVDALKQYVPWLKKAAEEEKKLAEEAKRLAESQREQAIDLEKQRVELESLVKIASGDVGTKQQQILALEKLNELIPDNIGFLTTQNIKTAEGTGIVLAYVKALEAQATAEAIIGRLSELNVTKISDEVELRRQLTPLFIKQKRLQKEIADASKREFNTGGSTLGVGVGQASDQAARNLKETEEDIQAVLDAFTRGRKRINEEQKILRQNIDEAVAASLTNNPKPIKEDKPIKVKAKKVEIVPPREITISQIRGVDLPELQINEPNLKGLGLAALSQEALESAARIRAAYEDVQNSINGLNASINAIINNFAIDAFSQLGVILGQGIASGAKGLEQAFAGLGMLIGDLMISLGKEMIKFAVQAQAIQVALKSLNPAIALAAGVALVALGASVKSKLQKTSVGAFAEGGIITGPTLGLVGEGGQPEVILPLSKINQFLDDRGSSGGELTTRVSGDDLLFIMNRATRRQNRNF